MPGRPPVVTAEPETVIPPHLASTPELSKEPELLQYALDILTKFRIESPSQQEVADGIRAKILRNLGRLDEADAVLVTYIDTTNTYTIVEWCIIQFERADKACANNASSDALTLVQSVINRIQRSKRTDNAQIGSYLSEAERRKTDLEKKINS